MSEKIHILVVEDEKQLRENLVTHLSNEGYDVVAVADGDEAIPRLYGKAFDVAVLDLKMQYINGFEVLKFIKATFPATKVIILTAYGDLKNVTECKRLGADEVIGKPYNLDDLFMTIQDMTKK